MIGMENVRLHSTWRPLDRKFRIAVSQRCFFEMEGHALQHLPNEVGTALVGSYSDDGTCVTIKRCAPLTADASSGRISCVRGVRGLATFFSELFTASKGEEYYVGEWHSHPGGSPYPSSIDDESSLAAAQDPSVKCPELVQLILAVHGESMELGVFVYSSSNHSRVDLIRDADEVTPHEAV